MQLVTQPLVTAVYDQAHHKAPRSSTSTTLNLPLITAERPDPSLISDEHVTLRERRRGRTLATGTIVDDIYSQCRTSELVRTKKKKRTAAQDRRGKEEAKQKEGRAETDRDGTELTAEISAVRGDS